MAAATGTGVPENFVSLFAEDAPITVAATSGQAAAAPEQAAAVRKIREIKYDLQRNAPPPTLESLNYPIERTRIRNILIKWGANKETINAMDNPTLLGTYTDTFNKIAKILETRKTNDPQKLLADIRRKAPLLSIKEWEKDPTKGDLYGVDDASYKLYRPVDPESGKVIRRIRGKRKAPSGGSGKWSSMAFRSVQKSAAVKSAYKKHKGEFNNYSQFCSAVRNQNTLDPSPTQVKRKKKTTKRKTTKRKTTSKPRAKATPKISEEQAKLQIELEKLRVENQILRKKEKEEKEKEKEKPGSTNNMFSGENPMMQALMFSKLFN